LKTEMNASRNASRVGSALHLLHRAGQCADELFAANVETDLTPRQYAVLKAVAKSADLSQTALVDETGIDRSTLADIVRRLIRKGFLQRRRTAHDARMYAVRLTAAGADLLKSAEPAAKSTEERLLSALPSSQRSAMIEALRRIVATLEPDAVEASKAKPVSKKARPSNGRR
jgi:DNA-binding MarR family transcriptional regulator